MCVHSWLSLVNLLYKSSHFKPEFNKILSTWSNYINHNLRLSKRIQILNALDGPTSNLIHLRYCFGFIEQYDN